MKNLFSLLLMYIDSAREEDTNFNIALYMAHHMSEVGTMGISKLAKACYVSPATISRFCRTLGYENFAHLKQECIYFSSDRQRLHNLIDVPFDTMKNDPLQCTDYYVQQVTRSISQLSSNLDWETVDQVLHLIHDSDQVALFATHFSHSAALHLQTDLLMLEKFTVAYMENDAQTECAKRLDENSVAIIVSVNGNYFINHNKIVTYLKKSKAKIVFITQNEELKTDLDPDYIIQIGAKEDARIGKHNLLIMMELMSLRYYTLFYPDIRGIKDETN